MELSACNYKDVIIEMEFYIILAIVCVEWNIMQMILDEMESCEIFAVKDRKSVV